MHIISMSVDKDVSYVVLLKGSFTFTLLYLVFIVLSMIVLLYHSVQAISHIPATYVTIRDSVIAYFFSLRYTYALKISSE